MTVTRLVLPSVVAAFLLSSAGTAAAQPSAPTAPPAPGYGYAPPPPVTAGYGKVDRRGFVIGFSLGAGSFNADSAADDEALEGVAVDIHLGAMLTPRLALLFDGFGVAHTTEGGNSIVHVADTLAAQYWLTPRLWLKGGLGFGRLTVNDSDGNEVTASENGTAAMAAVGYELIQTRSFALDVQLRGASVSYDQNDTISMGSIGIGFNWY